MTEWHDGHGWGLQIVSGDAEFQTSSGRAKYQSETNTVTHTHTTVKDLVHKLYSLINDNG